MKLQLLIPHYQEDSETVKMLLDSLAIQQNVDMNEIGVVICNDGTGEDFKLDLPEYPFKVEIYDEPHRGVSGTRNACFDHSTADYVMFCDADDMFFNACGLYIVFKEIDGDGFNTMVSDFVEETKNPEDGSPFYVKHEMDCVFVHGKIHKRQYLIDNNIRWDESLTIHEDSYFNILCQKLSDEVKYCPSPFYLWRWRDASVCRHDPKYILKTYTNMLDSNTALVKELLRRGRKEDAQFYAANMIYDAYFTLNKDEWINQENQEYRHNVEVRFARYYKEHKYLFESVPQNVRMQIVMTIKNRMFNEGLLLEHETFDSWIKKIEAME